MFDLHKTNSWREKSLNLTKPPKEFEYEIHYNKRVMFFTWSYDKPHKDHWHYYKQKGKFFS